MRRDNGVLQINQLEAFKSWLDSQDIPNRPGKGQYEALQVFLGRDWHKLYRTDRMVSHLSVQAALVPLLRRFVAEASVPWEAIVTRDRPA